MTYNLFHIGHVIFNKMDDMAKSELIMVGLSTAPFHFLTGTFQFP